ncbi:hypothetical protein OV203_28445 [Nannocystis sp. ILAH1]|uniref:hypothetical protein n=1 Tax=unclassified Nannocystis TaxID=2627009 RepID=UPI00226EE9DD|nr:MULTISPECIES: hypothetical protein [unclassified Nannocystis]MCY0991108.1 hypothetical protein [Nannocystis sp. ILAH1]MCY1064620.1 hypothetical protein [Nannocystis sp. RBIL2]
MPQCLTAHPTHLEVTSLEEGDSAYIVVVNSTASSLTVVFDPPVLRDASGAPISTGSVTGVSVNPSGPVCGTNQIVFTTAGLNTVYTVTVTYTEPPRIDTMGPPLDTPTKSPKFKPLTSCPPSAP